MDMKDREKGRVLLAVAATLSIASMFYGFGRAGSRTTMGWGLLFIVGIPTVLIVAALLIRRRQ